MSAWVEYIVMEYMKKRKCVKKSERSRFSNAFLTFFQEKVRAGYKTLRHIGENASCQLAKTEKRAKLDVFAFWETLTGQPETGRNNLKKPFFPVFISPVILRSDRRSYEPFGFRLVGLTQLRRNVRRKYSPLQRALAR